MAISDISLTTAMRDTLVSMQTTAGMLSRTQNRLATGKKVNSALDNPVNFFTAQAHTQRASDLSGRKDGMMEAIQGVRAANAGISGLTSLIESAKGLTQSARSSDRDGRNTLAVQFNTILSQMDTMTNDAQYKGKNFLKSDTLQVLFNEDGSSLLTITGFDATTAGMGVTGVTVGTADVVQGNIATVSQGTVVSSTAVHTAVANTTFGSTNIASGSYFVDAVTSIALNDAIISGSMLAASAAQTYGNTGGIAVTGLLINISTGGKYYSGGVAVGEVTDRFRSTGLSMSGINAAQAITDGVTINNMYFNGVTLAAADYTVYSGSNIAGLTGQVRVAFATSAIKAGMTGVTINVTYDLAIRSHAENSNGATQPNIYVYDLNGADTASGAVISSMAGDPVGDLVYTNTANQAGMNVFVSGNVALTGTYTFSGSYLVFASTAPPTTAANAIMYNYNTGFSTVTGPAQTYKTVFTGATLAASQTLGDVKINGFAASEYRVSGNFILFSGTDTTKIPQQGDTITYSITSAGATGSWESDAGITNSIDRLDAALATLRNAATTMGSTQNIIDIRRAFTDAFTAELLKGSDNLTLADMNEEGANMLMLQTRQQLGTTSLRMASESAASVMRLF